MIAAVYSEPQVAQVGQLRGDGIETVQVGYRASLKGHLFSPGAAFVKLAYEEGSGALTGGTAVGLHAADILAPVMVAIHVGMPVQDFAALYAAHPTLSELAFAAARLA